MLALVEAGCCFPSQVGRSSQDPCCAGAFVPLRWALLALPGSVALIGASKKARVSVGEVFFAVSALAQQKISAGTKWEKRAKGQVPSGALFSLCASLKLGEGHRY